MEFRKLRTSALIVISFLIFNSTYASDCSTLPYGPNWEMCKAIESGHCYFPTGSDYDFCIAITTKNCSSSQGQEFELCEDVTTGSCQYLPIGDEWDLCRALQDAN